MFLRNLRTKDAWYSNNFFKKQLNRMDLVYLFLRDLLTKRKIIDRDLKFVAHTPLPWTISKNSFLFFFKKSDPKGS